MRKRSLVLAATTALVLAGSGVSLAAPVAPAAAQPSVETLAEGDPLTWAPPPLEDPVTIDLGTGRTSNTLDADTDYIINLPDAIKTGSTTLKGGRNVVIIGGHIRLSSPDPAAGDTRAIYVWGNTGTVHIEGVLIDATADGLGDGIAISAPDSIVQVQNTRIVGLPGAAEEWHADVIQPWGGVKELRVDKLTGSSRYQGFFLPQDLGDIGAVTIKRTNLTALPEWYPGSGGGYMLWLSGTGEPFYDLSDFYVQPREGTPLGLSIWPNVNDPVYPAVIEDGFAQWPTLPRVTGGVHDGPPPGGDFVPDGVAGLNYVSPGYNLVGGGEVTASSVYQDDVDRYGPQKAVDGLFTDASRWLSAEGDLAPTLTIDFGATTSIGAIDVTSGAFLSTDVDPNAVLVDFAIEAHTTSGWQQLSEFTGNTDEKVSWTGQVDADQVRLTITRPSRSNPVVARVYEVEVRGADVTAPTLAVSGIGDGSLYGDSQDLPVSWEASDSESGLDRVVGRLDGERINPGDLALYRQPLGMHELRVVAIDVAGNRAVEDITFFVTTSFGDMENLITRFAATGRLPAGVAEDLRRPLGKSRKQEASDRVAGAITSLETFKDVVNADVTDADAHDTLLRDADAMILRLGGTPSDAEAGVAANEGQDLEGTGRLPEEQSGPTATS